MTAHLREDALYFETGLSKFSLEATIEVSHIAQERAEKQGSYHSMAGSKDLSGTASVWDLLLPLA